MVKRMCIDTTRTLSQSFSIVTEIPESEVVSPTWGCITRMRISYHSCGSGVKDQRKKKWGELLQTVSQLCLFLISENGKNKEVGCKWVNGVFLIFPWIFCLEMAGSLLLIALGEWKCEIWTEVKACGGKKCQGQAWSWEKRCDSAMSSLILWSCSWFLVELGKEQR